MRIFLILFAMIGLASASIENVFASNLPASEEAAKFQKWADDHNIILQGTNKKTNEVYYDGWDQSRDGIDWRTVPNSMNAYAALSRLPDDILQVAKGQTLYLSNQEGRSYTILGSWETYHILENINKGIILEQPIPIHTVLHEFGHVVDFNAIQCLYGCSVSNYNFIKDQRMSLFATPQSDNMDSYYNTNSNENFAEKFAYYVDQPKAYQEKISDDPTLKKEFDFLNIIFSGKTFS